MLVTTALIILAGCAGPEKKVPSTTDKTLRAKDAPGFLLKATPKGAAIDDVEYFIKKTGDVVTYELKYEEHGQEVSVHYTDAGKLIEKEKDIKFSSLSQTVQVLIRRHLDQRFKKYRIEETELRTTEDHKELIDVEVSHDEKPTGLSELSFTLTGEFVSEEVESMPQIETLN